ncbi:MAG: right-handed parallel beta-helix repeat-containing protein [Planctomycetota bacterium]
MDQRPNAQLPQAVNRAPAPEATLQPVPVGSSNGEWFQRRQWLFAAGGLAATALATQLPFSPGPFAAPSDTPAATGPTAAINASPAIPGRPVGVRGDGQTDDWAALQAAIRGGSLRLPAGTYRISKALEIDLAQLGPRSIHGDAATRLVMAGPGPAIRIQGTHKGTADPTTVTADVATRERFACVDGLEIVGDHPEADGIAVVGAMQPTLTRLLIRSTRHAIRLAERNRNVLIAHCHLYDNRGIGIWYDEVNLHQSNINACHISYCRQGGVVIRGGDVRNIQISGCDIEGNMSPDTDATANILIDCATGSVAEVAIAGCTIQHDAKSPDSANIRFLGRATLHRLGQPVSFQCGHLTIANNVFSDVRFNLDLQGVRGAAITGNTLWQGYDANLRLIDCDHVVISGNVLERNPLYGYTAEASNRVLVRDCRDLTIQGLHLHNVRDADAGVVLENTDRVQLLGCTILDCDNAGIELRNTRRTVVSQCVIRDDRQPTLDAPPRGPSVALRQTGENQDLRLLGNVLQDGPLPKAP